MASKRESSSVIIVTGDVTMDWNIARISQQDTDSSVWNAKDWSHAYWQRGGAALVADLIEAVAHGKRDNGKPSCEVRQMDAPRKPVSPDDSRYHHSYALWSPFTYAIKPPLDKKNRVWRVEEYLGLDRAQMDSDSAPPQWKKVVNDTPDADFVILDDAGMGLRNDDLLWPQALSASRACPWILLKMTRPVAQGKLWEQLSTRCAERLIVVMTANDLRLTEVQISRELSWERTAQDLAWELVYNPQVNALSRCAHVVVSFGTAGAFLLSRVQAVKGRTPNQIVQRCFLFFDPVATESTWAREYPGGMIGYTTCLTAGIFRQLMFAPGEPDIHQGIQSGLAAIRALHLDGYGSSGASANQTALAFPLERIADKLAESASPFAVAEVQDPVRFIGRTAEAGSSPANGFWTILEDRFQRNPGQVAQQIVLRGAETALEGVPIGRFGALLTVDRREIEAYRSIRALVSEYDQQKMPKPLSIAVFGPPGSGKSFGILELAKSLLPGRIEKLEFNLSQLRNSEDLLDAFHQIRDVGLSGRLPLVFWDEFDAQMQSERLGWLRYFLAPMQDGKFQHGQLTHPIGSAIFVFAGGTCKCIEEFGQGLDDEAVRAAKGPDFISRIKGYVNIMGPNPRDGIAATDPYYILRRAILLRSIFLRNRRNLFEKLDGTDFLKIDSGVLRALLHTRCYKHGVRSMESLVAMSALAGKESFERSALPAEAQLDLHVEGREFLALVQQMDLDGELLEKLAQAVHDLFCEALRAKGYRLGPKTDDKRKLHSSLRPYPELSEDEKEQNRDNVRDIANKLARIGYVMIPARSNQPPFSFPGNDLEVLAEIEHERWMKAKIEAGWRYAKETNKARKLHKGMVPWRRMSAEERARLYDNVEGTAIGSAILSESEKQKDRNLVRSIPRILARGGYTVVRVQSIESKE